MNYEEVESLVAVLRENPALTELEVRSGARSVRLRRAAVFAGYTDETQHAIEIANRSAAVSSKGNLGTALASGNGPLSYDYNQDFDAPLGSTGSSSGRQIESARRADARTTVFAELVGVFRSNRQANLLIGSAVTEEQSLGQIEAMRLLNDCHSPISGRILAILVQDGEPVEYGQPLFELSRLEPPAS